jgi:PAS domain S-box-containing protein
MTSTDRVTLGKRSTTSDISESAVAMLDERGTVIAWTQAAEQLLGYSARDVVGRSAALVLPPSEETPTISALIEQCRAHNDWSGTMTVRHRDGRMLDINHRISMLCRLAAIRELVASGEEARVTTGVPVKMFIADDRIGLISLERSPTSDSALIIHQSSLLDTLIALFQRAWADAVPIRFGPPDAAPTPDKTHHGTLLGLLAAGLTDEAIARHMGWHPRTAQRRVRDLMVELGAQTRFQAGLQAARRGWL